MALKSKRNKQSAVRHLENTKTSDKRKSKKDGKIIQTTQPLANSSKAKSGAILPNHSQLVSLRIQ